MADKRERQYRRDEAGISPSSRAGHHRRNIRSILCVRQYRGGSSAGHAAGRAACPLAIKYLPTGNRCLGNGILLTIKS